VSEFKTKLLTCLALAATFWVVTDRGYAADKAKAAPKEKPKAETPKTDGPSCVWVVEQGANKMYLAGTIHLLRDKDYPLPDVFEQAYKDSKKLVFELPPDSEGNGEVVLRMRKLGGYAPPDDLSRHLSADALKRVLEWADKNDFPADALKKYRPWFLSLTIAAVEYQSLGATPDHGLDNYFEKRADKDNKPGSGLESVEYQLTLFTSLSEKLQEELLIQTLNESETMQKDYEDLLSAWRIGDLDSLQKLLFRDADRFPELMDEFLIKRNKAWVAPLEKHLKSGDHVMVLVGAGHLGGKGGLIELLKAKGCTVHQLGAK